MKLTLVKKVIRVNTHKNKYKTFKNSQKKKYQKYKKNFQKKIRFI